MRILSIHADYIRYKVTRKTRIAEEPAVWEDEMHDCVVLFTCIEKLDEINPSLVIESAAKSVMERLGKLKVHRVMVFPYAHLTRSLSAPGTALQVLKGLEDTLRGRDFVVKRAPFGWYKEFELKSKGHPLADQSMTICPYQGRECDFECPYCHSPLRTGDGTGDGTPQPVGTPEKAGTGCAGRAANPVGLEKYP